MPRPLPGGFEDTMAPSDEIARYRILYDLGCAFAARIELEELIPLVIAKCREAFEAESVAILLLDPETRELYFPYVTGTAPDAAERLTRQRFPSDRGIAGAVFQTGQAVRVDDVQTDLRFYPGVDRATGIITRAVISAPLTSHQGPVGVLQIVNHRSGGPFTDQDLASLEALAGSVAVAIENARLYAHVKASEERLRAQVGALRRDIARRDSFEEIVGTCGAMAEVFRLMDSAAGSPISVLVEGETGTGKEMVARGIHRASARADGPFIPVNCAALPETLLESQLFGHRRGAFTGAIQDQRGLFEAASGGTIFLDEVGDMPLAMQAKLLRALQEGEIVPVGDTQPRKVDVRVISATNRDLKAGIEARTVREDLYYRLAAFPICLPPLRERREDIPLLLDYMVASAAKRHQKRIPGIEPSAVDLLGRFDWPGNVRELQNEIERAVTLAQDGEAIALSHLSPKLGPSAGVAVANVGGEDATQGESTAAPRSLRNARAAFETRHIADALREQGGNVSRTAEALGISRVMLQKKMKDYRLR